MIVLATEVAAQRRAETGVSDGDCKAFGYYILQEAREFADKMSRTFLTAASRFIKAGCATRDADGEIELVTQTRQDAESFRTARARMGKVDILALSGVVHCHSAVSSSCSSAKGR